MTRPISKKRKESLRGIVGKIERHKNAIAKHRDLLRAIQQDLESILESTNEGVEQMEGAITTMSQYL